MDEIMEAELPTIESLLTVSTQRKNEHSNFVLICADFQQFHSPTLNHKGPAPLLVDIFNYIC